MKAEECPLTLGTRQLQAFAQLRLLPRVPLLFPSVWRQNTLSAICVQPGARGCGWEGGERGGSQMTQLRLLPWREDKPAPGAPAQIGPETQAELGTASG